jgi:hypothetical protein
MMEAKIIESGSLILASIILAFFEATQPYGGFIWN